MYYYVDHTSRFGRNTGIQRCVRAIAAGLIGCGVPLHPVVWNREHGDLEPAAPEALEHLARWSGPASDAWAAQPAGQWLLIVELVSGPHQPTAAQLQQAASSRGLRLVWVFHDAIPLRLAQLYGARAASAAAHHRAYMAGLALAHVVLANSHTSAAQLRAFLNEQGLPSGHVQALPLAAQYSGVPRCVESKPSGSSGNRLLAVGSLEPRKNHGALLKAVAWLAAQGRFNAQLVLVGWPNDPRVVALVQRALALGLPLRWEAEADDARLLALYQWCDATVVASLDEGFGLPVAESLWLGRPCLCTTSGALGELAAAGGCLPLASPAWRDLAEALSHWLTAPELRARLQQQLVQRPLRSWAGYAAELLTSLAGFDCSNCDQRATPLA
jgi:glycosyltransferase involved in cell wall biosynthesis